MEKIIQINVNKTAAKYKNGLIQLKFSDIFYALLHSTWLFRPQLNQRTCYSRIHIHVPQVLSTVQYLHLKETKKVHKFAIVPNFTFFLLATFIKAI